MPDLTISLAIDAIHQHTGLPRSVIYQVARRQREDRLLPSSVCGSVPAKITAKEVAYILLGSLTAADMKDATQQAKTYGGLVRNLEQEGELVDHLAALMTCHARPLVDLTLDLTRPEVQTKLRIDIFGEGYDVVSDFVEIDSDPNLYHSIRRTIRLTGESFYSVAFALGLVVPFPSPNGFKPTLPGMPVSSLRDVVSPELATELSEYRS